MTVSLNLNIPQGRFLALPHKFRAYVAGFGSGKTWVGATDIGTHFWRHPGINQGYFAPSYPLIRDIFYPTVEEVFLELGLRVKIHQANKEIHAYEGRKYRGVVFCRSMDAPEQIVGFKIGNALIDELDLLKPEKAATAWRKIIARMRYKEAGIKNGISVTTTPEGFRFVYQQFYKAPLEKPESAALYGLVQASTYDNALNLPDDYISSLRASYPSQLISAYLDGKFVNLTSGAVYPDFDRVKNGTDATILPGEQLHIGMDFNVLKMAAVVFVIRDGCPLALEELTEVRDTPAMAKLLVERYRSAGHPITIYPDASGQNTSSKSASESDLTILREHLFELKVNAANPAVKDRVASFNALIENGEGIRRLKVNSRTCPRFTEGIEQQTYDRNGEPDKTGGHDHINDAGGYFLVKQWPVVKPIVAKVTQLRI